MKSTPNGGLQGRKEPPDAYVAVIVAGAILCGAAINLVPNALPASVAAASSCHALSAVHWVSALFLAAMIAFNMVRPVQMGSRHSCKCKTDFSGTPKHPCNPQEA